MTHRLGYVVATLVMASASCVAPRPRLDPAATGGHTLRVQLAESGRIQDVAVEQYVAGSILGEADIRGLTEGEAHQVAQLQAILARTYALANRDRHQDEGFDLCGTTHCQVYRPVDAMPVPLASLATAATRATTGLVVAHDGLPINAVFHADCGGGTSAAAVVWGGRTPSYLQAVDDPFCLRGDPPPWRFEVTHDDLLRALNEDPSTHVGAHLDDLFVTEHDASGRVVRVLIQGNQSVAAVRGEELRRIMTRRFGVHSIKSSRFSITQFTDRFVFEGRGFGHGVGLCQRGALVRVQAGHTSAEVLGHYYPGTSLTRYY